MITGLRPLWLSMRLGSEPLPHIAVGPRFPPATRLEPRCRHVQLAPEVRAPRPGRPPLAPPAGWPSPPRVRLVAGRGPGRRPVLLPRGIDAGDGSPGAHVGRAAGGVGCAAGGAGGGQPQVLPPRPAGRTQCTSLRTNKPPSIAGAGRSGSSDARCGPPLRCLEASAPPSVRCATPLHSRGRIALHVGARLRAARPEPQLAGRVLPGAVRQHGRGGHSPRPDRVLGA